MVQEGLCAGFVVRRMDFGSKVPKCQEKEVPRERHENAKPPQDKGNVKIEDLKGKQ